MREVGTKPDVASFEYLVKTRCAAMDEEGAWAARAEMEREYLDAPPQNARRVGHGIQPRRRREAREGGVRGGTRGGGGERRGDARRWRRRRGIRVCRGIRRRSRRGEGRGREGRGREGHQKQPWTGQKRRFRPRRGKSVQQFLRLRNGDALRQVADVEAHLERGSKFVDAVAAEVRRGPEDASSSVRIVEARTTRRGGWTSRRCSGINSRRVSRCAAGTETG